VLRVTMVKPRLKSDGRNLRIGIAARLQFERRA
jgi:hypothetical protein